MLDEHFVHLSELRDSLTMETGIIAKIADGQYTIMQISADLPVFNVGDTFELNDTYCAAVAEQKKTIVYNNVSEVDGMQRHPVYVMMQLLSYVGTPLYDNNGFWGTVNFASTNKKVPAFSATEIALVESFSQELGQSLQG